MIELMYLKDLENRSFYLVDYEMEHASPFIEESDEEQEDDIEDLNESDACLDNHASCINDKIDPVLEVLDEETILNLLLGYREALDADKVDESKARCKLQGCEFDYSSNTYRLMAVLCEASHVVAEHFVIVKIDAITGFPKILSVR